jgi:type IV pilus assembly protein PilW
VRSGRTTAQRGLGLVELMISVTLGLLVVVGVAMVFASTRQASRTADSLGHMQETLRTSFELMVRDLREAAGNPCDKALETVLPLANVLNNAQGATPTWWATWDNPGPLRGYAGTEAFPGAAIGSAVGERVTGTQAVLAKFAVDVGGLTVASHNTGTATFTVNNNPHNVQAGDLLMVCDLRHAAIFSAASVTATQVLHTNDATTSGNCSMGLGLPTDCSSAAGKPFLFEAGAKIGRLTAVGWYIGNNGRAESGGRSLYRVSSAGVEEVAEGVMDLQLTYLVDGGSDYVAVGAVADWSRVLAMRAAVTLLSAESNVAGTASGRIQRPLAFTVSVRNRAP